MEELLSTCISSLVFEIGYVQGESWCVFGTFRGGGGDFIIGGVTVDVWDPRPESNFIDVFTREGTHHGGRGIGLSLICWSQNSALFRRYPRPCSARSRSSNIGSFSLSVKQNKQWRTCITIWQSQLQNIARYDHDFFLYASPVESRTWSKYFLSLYSSSRRIFRRHSSISRFLASADLHAPSMRMLSPESLSVVLALVTPAGSLSDHGMLWRNSWRVHHGGPGSLFFFSPFRRTIVKKGSGDSCCKIIG